MLEILETLAQNNDTMFSYFKDVDLLTEEHCKKITGWSKSEFLRFSGYVKQIKETKNRSKYQLVALYRYWLRKGVDQFTLANLFSKDSTQRKISHYLEQIRIAINKEFVPFFLGTSNKNRDFFLKHNTSTAIELFDLKNDELVIVADGTYCRLEKSANNQFQYDTYSEQKKDSLFKPFVICCADGFIIDCYGAFAAYQNDSNIFKRILESDKNLIQILKPNKTFVLVDRGFRDLYDQMLNKYGFNVKIPTCHQLEEEKKTTKYSQLTTKQCAESRFVTKCRFIVEKQIGAIKNFKALNNIRNTEAGHIPIDYRIACAMINFSHIPCNQDGENLNIAKRIKKKGKIESNKLDFLLGKHFDSKLINSVPLEKLNDFPRINEKKLQDKIFLGIFQLRNCKSYLLDLKRNNKVFIIADSLKKKLSDKTDENELQTKIIGFEIISRHKRSKSLKKETLKSKIKEKSYADFFKNTYKVFVQYIPYFNSSKAIKGFICSCKTGQRVVGCCSHVAAVIYYMSFAKHNYLLSNSADYLNSILVNMESFDTANDPKYIRNKRGNKSLNLSNSSLTLSSSSSESSDDENKGNNSENFSNKSLNRHQVYNKIKPFTLKEFKRHVPKNGGTIKVNNENITLTNTCSIDYYLFAFWYLSKIDSEFTFKISSLSFSDVLKEIIQNISQQQWDKAKEIWVLRVLNFQISYSNKELSLYGSEDERFIKSFGEYQKHDLIQKCSESCIQNLNLVIREDSEIIFFKKIENQVRLFSCFTTTCTRCKKDITTNINFKNSPIFIFIQSADANITVRELPNTVEIQNRNYKFVCGTIHMPGHFLGVFDFKKKLYIVDDLKKNVKLYDGSYHKTLFTTVSLYYQI
ncbi:unnamed protein product [Brachionus calyciflorus]|uniref:SWIM-type domain-containing protein n=1 Tax=Brachionus calyciflorus TaxID=104777 RepID=A0A814FZU2_9BILA|nr:unnamed protein product [Brachionus calyciflorus]